VLVARDLLIQTFHGNSIELGQIRMQNNFLAKQNSKFVSTRLASAVIVCAMFVLRSQFVTSNLHVNADQD
jgi:hypothetical protein